MPLEILSDDLHKEIAQKKLERDNTISCHIKVDDGLVKVTIPKKSCLLSIGDTEIEPQNITLTFSKREIKELLQDIYVS